MIKTRRGWHKDLWQKLLENVEDQSKGIRLVAVWPGHEDLRFDVDVINDKALIEVTPEILDKLEGIDRERLKETLQPEQWTMWQRGVAKLKSKAGQGVSMASVVRCVGVPIACPDWKTISVNVYQTLKIVDGLRDVLPPEVFANIRPDGIFIWDIATVLKIPTIAEGTEAEVDGANDFDETTEEEAGIDADEADETSSVSDYHRNVIFFGPPGTGKSHFANEIAKNEIKVKPSNVYRVTFHPEYSYFDFVGSYRPAVGHTPDTRFVDADGKGVDFQPHVYYRFEPGPFSKALVKAINQSEPVMLIIEEINRGNCAAIFGDVFQLLDRVNDSDDSASIGISEYGIIPSSEWAAWLCDVVPGARPAWDGERLKIPPNLYLFATMNTSDQSLFPMDTAFRRRWGMQYCPIKVAPAQKAWVALNVDDQVGVPWGRFIEVVNKVIVEATGVDDKQMGPWFVKAQSGCKLVDSTEFSSKVLFYLWNDVFRNKPAVLFDPGIRTYNEMIMRFEDGKDVFRKELIVELEGSTEPVQPAEPITPPEAVQ